VTEQSDGPCGRADIVKLSDTGGLTQFGAVIETLYPGARSSNTHWHTDEDEMVHMLEGEVVLVEGDSEATLRAGDTATFKAGVTVGHRLDNRSDAPARYLVVGTRATRDTVTYTDTGRAKHLDGDQTRWTDLDGNPSDDPFLKIPRITRAATAG